MNDSWVLKHFIKTVDVASDSKDDSTKCGAVIVRQDNSIASTGYNGFPRGVLETPERMERPAKYLFTEHAERNAIYNCADQSLEGYSIFVFTYPHELFTCADCARAIIQSGIKYVYYPRHSGDQTDREMEWNDSTQAAHEMFLEAGVEVHNPTLPEFKELINSLHGIKEYDIIW